MRWWLLVVGMLPIATDARLIVRSMVVAAGVRIVPTAADFDP